MKIRLGYVAMTLNLHKCSPSGTVTVSALSKLPDDDARLYRLRRVARENLQNTLRILRYNQALNVKVYRLTSKLIPLATYKERVEWDYIADFQAELREIGYLVRENNFRVSAHPDHFTLINSHRREVFEDAVRDLEYHTRVFTAMGLGDCKYKLVLHVGGLYKDKESSLQRFKDNFSKLSDRIRNRIIIENDDKSFTARDVLGLCQELKTPMVLDVHHHACNSGGDDLGEMLPHIFDTWEGQEFVPKVHFSSPKNEKDFRSHADDIDPGEFMAFMKLAKGVDRDLDIMLEAKNKDSALINLMEQLKKNEEIKVIDKAAFSL